MQKNTSGKWVVFAFEDEGGTNPGEPVTGDAAQITANIRIDGGAANPVDYTNPTELEGGYYIFDITAAEANGDLLVLCPSSSTSNVNVIGVPGAVWTEIGVDVKKWLGTAPETPNIAGVPIADIGYIDGNAATGGVAQTGDVYAELPMNFSDLAVTATMGLVSSNVTQISGDGTAADRLEAMLDAMPASTVNDGSATTTSFITALTEASDDHYNSAFIVFTDGALLGQSRKISDYAGATKTITVATAFTEAPGNGDAFIIVGRSE